MTSQPPDDPKRQHGVSFSIHADGVLHGLSFEARAENPDDARVLIDHFWSSFASLQNAQRAATGGEISKIRQRMREIGMSFSDLSRATGISTGQVSAIFLGKGGLTPERRLLVLKAVGLPTTEATTT